PPPGGAGPPPAPRARETAAALPMNALTRAWSLLLKGLGETQTAPDPVSAGEIALIRLAFAADLPTPDEALRLLKGEAGSFAPSAPPLRPQGGGGPGAALAELVARAHAAPAPMAGPRLDAFTDVVRLAEAKRDLRLKVELESYVHLIAFEPGRIEMRLHDKAPADLPQRLMMRLKEWTGRVWAISVNSGEEGRETLRDARTAEVMAHPLVKKAFEVFPGAEILLIRDPQPEAAPAAPDDEMETE
ncbi:MAG: DNA polymerase III subunit gamma/tau, partial [Parvularculaceae bacterium]